MRLTTAATMRTLRERAVKCPEKNGEKRRRRMRNAEVQSTALVWYNAPAEPSSNDQADRNAPNQ
jgi:hypothetical protein